MERRSYFVIGDILACAVAGGATGWLTQYAVPGDWYILIGMAIGMALGMVVGMLVGVLFSPFFGAFELLLPASLGGILAGLVVGGLHTTNHVTACAAAGVGVAAALAVLVFTYFLQSRLSGDVR